MIDVYIASHALADGIADAAGLVDESERARAADRAADRAVLSSRLRRSAARVAVVDRAGAAGAGRTA